MDVFFWAIDPRVAFWTRFEANFRLGGNQGPLFLNGLTSPRVPGQLLKFKGAIVAPSLTGGTRSLFFVSGKILVEGTVNLRVPVLQG
jgi:hypothetical protein